MFCRCRDLRETKLWLQKPTKAPPTTPSSLREQNFRILFDLKEDFKEVMVGLSLGT